MNLNLQQNQEWLGTREVANLLGITRDRAGKLLKTYAEYLTEYTQTKPHPKNPKQKMIFISKEGVLILANLRNLSGSLASPAAVNSKKQLAEKAIASNETINQLVNAVGLLTSRLQKLEEKNLPQIAAPIAPLSLRDQFRREVNIIAQRLRIPHNTIFGSVYERLYYPPFSVNVNKQAENKGCAKIDILDDEGLFPVAIQLAKELYPDNTLF